MSDILQRFLDAPEDHGLGGVVPSGKYPVEIIKAQGVAAKRGTSVEARLQLLILEGPHKDTTIYITHYLPNLLDETSWEKERWINQVATLVKVLGATLHADPLNNPEGFDSPIDAVVAAFNVEDWKERQFIADIQFQSVESQWKRIENQKNEATKKGEVSPVDEVTPDQLRDKNTLGGWFAFNDPRNGIETWRRTELKKQELQMRGTSGPNPSTPSSSAPSLL